MPKNSPKINYSVFKNKALISKFSFFQPNLKPSLGNLGRFIRQARLEPPKSLTNSPIFTGNGAPKNQKFLIDVF